MSGPDAMHDEMPGFFPGRPGGEHDEPLLDMLLERRPIPPGAPPELHDLARMLDAAAGPGEPGDLAGEAAARAAFSRLPSPAGTSRAAPRSARHRLTERPARGRLPLAAALAMAAAGLGSATAAYVGVLPSPIQHLARVVIGAPPPTDGAPPQPLLVVSSCQPVPSPVPTSPAAPRRSGLSSAAASRRFRLPARLPPRRAGRSTSPPPRPPPGQEAGAGTPRIRGTARSLPTPAATRLRARPRTRPMRPRRRR